MAGPIAEIAEADADARTRAIYDDIKRVSGTPLVNLIYRHLATMPGVLEWAWGNISRNGGYARLADAASRLPRHRLCIALPRQAWSLAGLSKADIAAMSRLVDNYNKTNAINLIAVTCLGQALASGCGSESAAVARRQASGHAPQAATAPRDDVQAVRRFLNELVSGQPYIEPTMFRNFEQWPASLAMASAILAPLAATGALEAARAASIDSARRIVDELAAAGTDMQPLAEPAATGRASAALSLFQLDVIGAMLPVGHALADALDAGTAPQ